MQIKIDALKELAIKTLSAKNYSGEQASEITEVLLYAEMIGKNTQGILKLLGTEPIQNIQPKYEPKKIKDTKLSALIDGGGNPGILVSKMATKIAIKKCGEHGFGIVGTNNTFSSTGVIGYYANEIAKNDFIGLVMAGSPGGVAPHGGIEPLFGTNPIAFGFPTEEDEPLIFDMATAAITWYGLVRAKALGQEIPNDVAIDNEGNLTSDPEKAMNGAILPFDRNYKGSGLSMMIEIFTGPLVGASFVDVSGKGDWGNIFIAIDPDLLVGKEEFKQKCSELIEKVRNSKTKHNQTIRIPGEEGLKKKNKAEKEGVLEIEDKIYNQLQELI